MVKGVVALAVACVSVILTTIPSTQLTYCAVTSDKSDQHVHLPRGGGCVSGRYLTFSVDICTPAPFATLALGRMYEFLWFSTPIF